MKKILCVFALYLFLLPSFAAATGNDDNEDRRAIYFCTSDVERLHSITAEQKKDVDMSDYVNDPAVISVYEGLNNNKHTFLRHCFFLLAEKMSSDANTITLKSSASLGYGSYGYGSMGTLLNKHETYGKEEGLKNKTLSCVPVVEKNDLGLISSKSGKNIEDVYDAWSVILRIMDTVTGTKKYNVFGHNCCTAAYDILVKLVGYDEATKLVNPSEFNLRGLGILWGQWVGAVTESTASIYQYIRMTKKIENNAGNIEPVPQVDL
jgi:hypothetical protein